MPHRPSDPSAHPARPAEGAYQAGPHRCRRRSSSPTGAGTGPASRRSPTAADIGFGSFYNHFDSKDELFATASAEVLERWGQMIDRACAEVVDPAEIFAVSFRISGGAFPDVRDTARQTPGVSRYDKASSCGAANTPAARRAV